MLTAAALVVLSLLVLVSAWWVVALHNLFRAALSLGVVLIGVAGVFILLEAEFLAFVQILIYVGAVLTLVVFAIMLTAKLQTPQAVAVSRQQGPAAVASAALFVILASATPPPADLRPDSAAITLPALGQELVT